jgi:hypothetical protein
MQFCRFAGVVVIFLSFPGIFYNTEENGTINGFVTGKAKALERIISFSLPSCE